MNPILLLLLFHSFLPEPGVKSLLRFVDGQGAFHPVMSKTAQFGAGDFVSSRSVGSEPYLDSHSRHCVLFDAQIRKEKAMDDILRTQPDLYRTADREVHFTEGDDIVFRCGICTVQTDIVR